MIKLIFGFLLVTTLVFSGLLVAPGDVYAQRDAQREACIGAGGQWDDNANTCTRAGETTDVADVINRVSRFLLSIVGAVAVIMLIVGGFRYIISAGNASALEGAKNTILYAIIGIVVVVLSYALVTLVINQLSQPTPQQPTPQEEQEEQEDENGS